MLKWKMSLKLGGRYEEVSPDLVVVHLSIKKILGRDGVFFRTTEVKSWQMEA